MQVKYIRILLILNVSKNKFKKGSFGENIENIIAPEVITRQL